jgi:PiT family inorganic phosphate transporter
MLDLLLLAPFLFLAFILAIGIGANDETFAPVVGARRLTPLQCVLIGAVLAIFGALTLGNNVAGTVGKGISSIILTNNMIFSVLLGMAIVLILSSAFGLPISSTHAMVGSITGLAIYEAFLDKAELLKYVNTEKIFTIIISWFVSPAIGLLGSILIYKLISKVALKYTTGLDSVERNETIAANLLLIFVVITALSRGGNDVANAVSPLMQTFSVENLTSIPLLLGGIGMAVGLILLARKVLMTLGNEIVELTPIKALAVQISTASITFFGAFSGIPLSGTHILVSCFIGVAISSKSRVNNKLLVKIGISAVSTPVFGAILSLSILLIINTLNISF